MFCANCAAVLGEGDAACGQCGSKVGGGGASPQDRVAGALGDTRAVSREIARDPTGNLGAAFAQLGAERALLVSVVFVALFAGAFSFAAKGIASLNPFGGLVPTLPLFLGAAAFPAALAGTFAVARKLAAGEGTFAADLFIAAVAVLPLGIVWGLVGLLGVQNVEVLVVAGFSAFCMTVMLLFAGLSRLSQVNERVALFLVPIAMLLAAWGAKVVATAVL